MDDDSDLSAVPGFAHGSPRLIEAYRFARVAHEGPRSQDDTGVDHPASVAELLHEAGYSEHVVVAALLHDTVEDTATGPVELRARFGHEVAELVAHLTENPDIGAYSDRKRELRARATEHGQHAAAIFAADKLANIRAMVAADEPVPPEKLEHYRRTLDTLRERRAEAPFLDELASQLDRLRARG